MTCRDAEEIVRKILGGTMECVRTKHFWEEALEEGFTAQDLDPILRTHEMRGTPEWKPLNSAFRVRLVGKCREGRATLLVIDLRADGPCAYVTIMVDNASPTKRRTR